MYIFDFFLGEAYVDLGARETGERARVLYEQGIRYYEQALSLYSGEDKVVRLSSVDSNV